MVNSTQIQETVLQLRGVGNVPIIVNDEFGEPAENVTVRLNASGILPDEALPFSFSTSQIGFTDSFGRVQFENVPLGSFNAQAELGPLGSFIEGVIDTPDITVPVTISLAPTGKVSGRVLLPDGFTVAAQTFATLSYVSQTSENGILQVKTGVDGRFQFSGIPYGPISLEFLEPAGGGIASRVDNLSDTSDSIDFGDIRLDNTAPFVSSVFPSDGAVDVPENSMIEIQFNEFMSISSFSLGNNIGLYKGNLEIPGKIQFETTILS